MLGNSHFNPFLYTPNKTLVVTGKEVLGKDINVANFNLKKKVLWKTTGKSLVVNCNMYLFVPLKNHSYFRKQSISLNKYTTCKSHALFTTESPISCAIPATQVCSVNIYGMNETIGWHFRSRVVVSTQILLWILWIIWLAVSCSSARLQFAHW